MRSSRRWGIVAILFTFMLIHQMDRLLIGPLTTPIMETYGIDEVQMGAIFTAALVVYTLAFPIWGYLYDRFTRAKLLALASFLWGATTWLSAIAPTYPLFLASRASTGVDDSSYPGLYSLISDYFGPTTRGKIYGLLQLAMPLGYLAGMGLALGLGDMLGWRKIYYITGSLGVLIAVVIFFFVKDVPRGKAEPELADLEQITTYKFDMRTAMNLFRKPTLLLMLVQGFFGIFPWNVITYWFFRYLETERGYDDGAIIMTMGPAVIVLALGYFVGGAVGDYFFKRTPRGRVLVSLTAAIIGAILFALTMNIPIENQGLFLVMLCATALFIPVTFPNVIGVIHDVTLPEVRSTALSVQYLMDNIGSAVAPLIVGIIAKNKSLHFGILITCVLAWGVGVIFLALTAYVIPKDIAVLRQQMQERAVRERAKSTIS